MREAFRAFARAVNAFSASPLATFLAFFLIVIWATTGKHFHYSDTWQLAMNTTSSIVTFLMVFIIANAQKRDTDALNLKLDMLVAANRDLSNRAVGIETATEAELREAREEVLAIARDADPAPAASRD